MSQPWIGLPLYPYPPIPLLERALIKIREDQMKEAIVIAPRLAKEILVPLPDGVQDPPPATKQRGSSVTTPVQQGRALYHTDL